MNCSYGTNNQNKFYRGKYNMPMCEVSQWVAENIFKHECNLPTSKARYRKAIYKISKNLVTKYVYSNV